MTWTLRFYDENGDEIAYVEKPDRETYNVVVTHPDSGWDEFRHTLAAKERVHVDVDVGPIHPGGWIDHGPQRVKLEPEEHLEAVKEHTYHPAVDSTTLADE